MEVLQDDLPATLYATGQLHHLLSVRTTKPINENEQLLLSYGKPFWKEIRITDQGNLTYPLKHSHYVADTCTQTFWSRYRSGHRSSTPSHCHHCHRPPPFLTLGTCLHAELGNW